MNELYLRATEMSVAKKQNEIAKQLRIVASRLSDCAELLVKESNTEIRSCKLPDSINQIENLIRNLNLSTLTRQAMELACLEQKCEDLATV